MASGERVDTLGTLIVTALAAVATLGIVGPGLAAPAWVRQAFSVAHGGATRTGDPPVGRYVMDDGRVFVLDHATGATLIKFEDSPEVWALQATHGPRGDVIYKNDVDEPMLRETQMGGMTVFTTRRPDGAAAALSGPTSSLRLAPLGPVVLYQRLFQASVRASRLAQHVIGFECLDADAASDGLIADAAFVAVEAAAIVVAQPGGRARLSRLNRVTIRQGGQPAAAVHGAVLAITVDSARGIPGRPSSDRIARTLLTRR